VGTNVVIPNLTVPPAVSPSQYNYTFDFFYIVWKLTRALKATGWKYLASSSGTTSNGTTKDTSGIVTGDKWGPGVLIPNSISAGHSGSGAVLTPAANNFVTITFMSGMSSSSIGRGLSISGSPDSTHNGIFTIVSVPDSNSCVVFNPSIAGGIQSGISWDERVSGSGTITWSAVTNGREQTISGLSGMTPTGSGSYGSANHYLKLENTVNTTNDGIFEVLSYVNPTTVIINNPNGVADTRSGYWTELDPLGEIYPNYFATTSSNLCWIVLQGPSTLQIPINAAPSGTFINGEVVTQSGTGAKGEFVSYIWDVPTSTGWLVLMPRTKGTGGGVYGWSTSSSTITGATSSATVTTGSSTPVEFVREAVIQKGSSASGYSQAVGNISFQVVDGIGEQRYRFGYLAANAASCNATVAPGGSLLGNLNAFPAIGSYVVKGNPAYASTQGASWFFNANNYPSVVGRSNIILTNASFTSTSSADGTFTVAIGSPSFGPGTNVGWGFYRLDNTEDGDVDPYVWHAPYNSRPTSFRTFTTRSDASIGGAYTNVDTYSMLRVLDYGSGRYGENSGSSQFRGTCRRGWLYLGVHPVFDYFQTFVIAYLGNRIGHTPFRYPAWGNNYPANSIAATYLYGNYTPDGYFYIPSTILPLQRATEPIYIVSEQSIGFYAAPSSEVNPFTKIRKGTLRWAFWISGGSGYDTYNNRTWIQLSGGSQAEANNGYMVVGPWDGFTAPIY
jgi:hypothetical protein